MCSVDIYVPLISDCIECMACSDNVVRAGLTPKFKDVEVLISMLNYRGLPASDNFFLGNQDKSDPNVTIFNPPIPDFAITKIEVRTTKFAFQSLKSKLI